MIGGGRTPHYGTVVLRFDGGARPTNPGPAACAWTLTPEFLPYAGWRQASSRRLGRMTNNEAEYMGLCNGLATAMVLGMKHIEVRSDSKLIVEQMSGRWQCRSHNLRKHYEEATRTATYFKAVGSITFVWVPREENAECDAQCTALLT